MNQVRFGIIGIGNMGTGHADNLMKGRVARAALTAVADIRQDRREWAEKSWKDVAVFETAEALMDSGLVDVVLIAVPHTDHVPLSILAFEKGLHVIVEKPASVSVSEAARMNAAAEKAKANGQIFGIMYNQRTNPLFQKMRDIVQSGELGQLFRTNWIITDWFRTQSYYNSGGWRATWAGEGGGVLLNQDPHQLDIWQWVCGMPSKVRAFMGFGRWHKIEVEDDVTAYVEYENGATGVFVTTTAEAPGTNRFEVVGENGKLVLEHDTLTFFRNRESMRVFCETSPLGFATPECWKIEIPVKGEATQHVGIMKNFTDAVLDGTPLLAPGEEGIRGLTISNAMHLSAWTDSMIPLPLDTAAFDRELSKRIASSDADKSGTLGADAANLKAVTQNPGL